MADYPRSLREFQRRFPDDAACGEHLARTRWPEGFACPRCGGREAWRLPSRTPLTFGCKGCGKRRQSPPARSCTAPPAAQRVVLGGLSGCDPFQRHVRKTAPERARHRFLRDRLAPFDETQGGDDRARADPAFRLRGGGRDDDPLSHQGRSACRRAGKKPRWQAPANRRRRSRQRQKQQTHARAHAFAPIADFARNSLHAFIGANTAPGTIVKTDGLAAYLGAPNVTHEPHVVGTMAAHVVLPVIASSPTSRHGRSASIMACGANTRRPTSMSSCSDSIDATPGTRASLPSSVSQ